MRFTEEPRSLRRSPCSNPSPEPCHGIAPRINLGLTTPQVIAMTMNRESPRAPLTAAVPIPASSHHSGWPLGRKRHSSRRPLVAGLLAGGLILLALPCPAHAQSSCCAGGPFSSDCNVFWTPTDSVTACPAGDSVYAGRPSRLYIKIHYEDNNCQVRQGVPPESI